MSKWKIKYSKEQQMYFIHIPKRMNDLGIEVEHTLMTQTKSEAQLIAQAPILEEQVRVLEDALKTLYKKWDYADATKTISYGIVNDALKKLEEMRNGKI